MPKEQTVQLSLVDRPAVPDRETIDQAALVELAESMRDRGLLSPVGVVSRGDRFEVVWGDRRCAAARVLGWSEIRAVVHDAEEAAVEELRYTENGQREALKPLEEARVFSRIIKRRGINAAELARSLRKSAAVVRSRLALLDFPLDLQAAIQAERIAPSVAAPLAEVEDEAERRRLLEFAIGNGASAQVTRYWADQWLSTRAMVDATASPPVTQGNGAQSPVAMYPCGTCGHATPIPALRVLHLCETCNGVLTEQLQHAST